jgi:hypothetical protein
MLILRWTREAIRRAIAPASFVVPDEPADIAWASSGACRNCGAGLATLYCAACGQKAATRLSWTAFVRETWERVRLFELQALTTATRLLLSPGRVAREYVLGRRSANMHPLKLLVALVAILVVMLAANQYFASYAFSGRDVVLDRMAARVMLYANWSFSLGIFAIFLGSWTVLRRRLGYNVVEHATLAIYCQSVTLGLVIVNLLPTLIWHDAQFIVWHKAASQYYMFAIKLLVVAVGYKQFFLLSAKRDWPRWTGALAVYALSGWLLLRLYAVAILWLVT